MVARRVLAFASLALALGSGVPACVGDDPASTPGPTSKAMGDRLGPCFPDGKCKEGLVCRDGEICLTPDEPKPVMDAGGSVSDAATDVETLSVAGDAAACTATKHTNTGPACQANGCDLGTVCCPIGAVATCGKPGEGTCPQTAPYWACQNDTECGGGALCCVFGTPSTEKTTSCVAKIKDARSSCSLDPNGCTAQNGRRTCNTNTDCFTQNCRLEEIQTAAGFTVVAKLCAQ